MGTSTWQAAFDHNLSIILDLAMGGAYPNGVCDCTSPTSSTASGGTMSVAYVAAYSTSGSGGGGGGGAGNRHTGPITGYQGLCVDVRGAIFANFTPVQVYTCNGTNAQQWTVVAGGQHPAGARQVHGHQRRRHRRRHDRGPLHLQRHRRAGPHPAIQRRALQPAVE